jgi:hypothetical protein
LVRLEFAPVRVQRADANPGLGAVMKLVSSAEADLVLRFYFPSADALG